MIGCTRDENMESFMEISEISEALSTGVRHVIVAEGRGWKD
jgi:hypothetical protein